MSGEILNKALVSVIIPSYNRAVYLEEAVESVIRQTYRPIECIVVDDGSTDNTKAVVENLIPVDDQHFFLKYIFQNNAGAQVARNTGTKASTGVFIQYLDSDDLLYPDKLKTQVDFLQSNPNCDGVFGDWRKGTVLDNELIISHDSPDLVSQFISEHCIHTLSFLMRRSIINKGGSWDINIKRNQEIDFHLSKLMAGASFIYQQGVCGLWRLHDGERITNTTGLKELIFFYKKWEKILRKKKMFTPRVQKAFAKSYVFLFHQNLNQPIILLRKLVEDVYVFNKGEGLFNYSKIRFLISIIGEKATFYFWVLKAKISRKSPVQT